MFRGYIDFNTFPWEGPLSRVGGQILPCYLSSCKNWKKKHLTWRVGVRPQVNSFWNKFVPPTWINISRTNFVIIAHHWSCVYLLTYLFFSQIIQTQPFTGSIAGSWTLNRVSRWCSDSGLTRRPDLWSQITVRWRWAMASLNIIMHIVVLKNDIMLTLLIKW